MQKGVAMGLHLAVRQDDKELDGFDIGSYADFDRFLSHVSQTLEGGEPGAKFPAVINGPDRDEGEGDDWSVKYCGRLRAELAAIAAAMKAQPPVPFASAEHEKVAKAKGITPRSAYESFINGSGQFLLDGLQRLASTAVERQLPIQFM
jgi:hypothetical protein